MVQIKGPDELYGEVYDVVQKQHVFTDSKIFADAVPRSNIDSILAEFAKVDRDDASKMRAFVNEHFVLPSDDHAKAANGEYPPLSERIEELWDILSRGVDMADANSSLIELPHPYIVPGGRFREVYYWDSYFSMLGLAESGRSELIENMVQNFAYLIDQIGFIPNGNRTYYCTRSQPPYFAMMVEFLAKTLGDETRLHQFLPQLQREYDFWMDGADSLGAEGDACRRVIRVSGGYLNRYWDDSDQPRAESYAEDFEHAAAAGRPLADYCRDIRAACESGWDFSSRWLRDGRSIGTVRATQVIPIDLNALMYNFECTLARAYRSAGNNELSVAFERRAADRKQLLQSLFFDSEAGIFMDLCLPDFKATRTRSIAMAYPLFFGIATPQQAAQVATCINRDFLKAGGWVTTNDETGQQWDSPNGWAPMQWITYVGLKRYGFCDEARDGAARWVENNRAVYKKHGCLLEKYNVVISGIAGAGGEYEVQEGFGWTNGVLLRLIRELGA